MALINKQESIKFNASLFSANTIFYFIFSPARAYDKGNREKAFLFPAADFSPLYVCKLLKAL